MKLNKLSDIQWARAYLLQIYSKENSYQEYHAIAKEYYPMQDSIKNQQSLNRLAFLNAKIEDTEQKQEIVLLNQTIRQKEVRQYWISVVIGLGVLVLLPLLYFRMRVVQIQRSQLIKEKKTAEELSQMNEKLQSLDEMKSHFFTNISHEFRTPLTIINGMVDQIKNKPDLWLEKGTKMIKANASNLLNLVNQILDLKKLESGSQQLNLSQGDVIQYLRYIAESHQNYAENEGLHLHFLSSENSLIMDYDPDKLLRIISNLLSNAVKNTPSGQHIYFQLEQKLNSEEPLLEIRIKDTGIGIPENQLSDIFERFYQVDHPIDQEENYKVSGTGIGLALTKELVKLMDGKIEVSSEVGKGTTFTVSLPIRKNATYMAISTPTPPLVTSYAEKEISPELTHIENSFGKELPTLLIVEDNTDVVQFLIACLQDEYQLEIARNGQEGINQAIALVPDLIVSDVMMPKKDGFELCKILKEDERTSHIPIILLTAKVDMESKISGLEKGADDYLTKPFEGQELLVRLRNLLALRKKLQQRYSSIDADFTSIDQTTDVEDAFLLKIKQFVEENISDDSFGNIQLARKMNLSESQLYRKIKALTDKSTAIFIRSIRLHKGKELLQSTDLTVSEIAYEVGFTNLPHFSRSFSKEFGKSPNAIRK